MAEDFCQAAESMIGDALKELSDTQGNEPRWLFSAFQQPAPAVMTPFKLNDLRLRLHKLRSLISKENRGDDEDSSKRLAEFLMLNPHD